MNQQRTLVKKLAQIMSEVKYIEKKGYNQHGKYKYFREEDIADAIREKLAEKSIMIFPRMVEKQVDTAGSSKNGTPKFLTTIKMEYTIADGESGEEIVISQGGQGNDSGDKGIYKATTGANKYALVKLFQIPTGDDPERDDRGGQQPPGGGQAPRRQQQPPQQPPQQGTQQQAAPSYGDALKAAKSIGWDPQTMMNNANAYRQKHGAAPIQKWNDGEPTFRIQFFNIMLQRARGGQ